MTYVYCYVNIPNIEPIISYIFAINMTFNKDYSFNDLPLLPPELALDLVALTPKLVQARTEIAELKGYLHSLPIDPMLIISPSILRESLASSEIEDIHTTLADVLQAQLLFDDDKNVSRADKEVLQYRNALMWGFKHLEDHGLSTRLILGIQHKLLPQKREGYKRDQNFIVDAATRQLIYTPPSPTEMDRLMYNWENFTNDKADELDPLIRCAISHYQFESIHPFEDGNGRTGRILVVLQLVNEGLLPLPTFFISGYLIQNRIAYYKHLREVTATNSWDGYISFMLEAFYHQAKQTKKVVLSAKGEHSAFKSLLKTNYPNLYSADLVNALFRYPIINPGKLAEELGVHRVTAARYLKEMTTKGLLKETKVGTYHLYINHRLLDVMHNQIN